MTYATICIAVAVQPMCGLLGFAWPVWYGVPEQRLRVWLDTDEFGLKLQPGQKEKIL
jgi:hypothetical protein